MRLLAVLAAVLALAGVPAAAFGQSAGDDQYQDPFAGQGGGQEEPEPQPEPEPEAPAEPAPAAVPETAPETVEAAPAVAQPQLPYTGGRPGLVALAGGGLLLAGLTLRARFPDGARRP